MCDGSVGDQIELATNTAEPRTRGPIRQIEAITETMDWSGVERVIVRVPSGWV